MSLSYLQQESTPILPDSIWALKWTSSNKLLSGSADGHLRIWDPTELSKPLYDLTSNPLAISSISTDSSGRYGLSTSLDGTVVLVDIENGEVRGRVETGREVVGEGEKELPAFTSAIHPQQKCWAWSGRSSKVAIRSIDQDLISAESQEGVNGDSSNKKGGLGGDGKVVDTGKGKFGMDVQFSPDGQSLALSTEQGQVIVIDVETSSVVATYTSHNKAVRTITWSPDSQWLYSGSDDHLIVLYDVRAGSSSGVGGKGEGAVAMMQGHQSWVLKVDASPDGKLLGSGGADSMIKLWDVGQRACVSTSTGNSEIWGIAWQPTASDTFAAGKQFVVGGDDRAITLFRAAGSV
ncbi:hypothetical protein I302_103632 [Kwoniella bestiolae CBS 10118]|uniref:Anaphase-promoting complex subunit 4 WD40 domain-containing protein n=1 Tax=Kwoniella bestiolae CBS 10118 TaxID=1296100 RepID=A0A1B9G8W6_9TREE|nr:hypothetical protein I302_02336 [Kwoniella bestiolae CBS 10118]OCF27494.1 hypothetical protein I302_02336 [Kwoniella bestiolae CBS 10118]